MYNIIINKFKLIKIMTKNSSIIKQVDIISKECFSNARFHQYILTLISVHILRSFSSSKD